MWHNIPNQNEVQSCFCVGPQPGMPACPCRMKNMQQVDGRWVEIRDHGPVSSVNEGSDGRNLLTEIFKDRSTD